MQKFFITWWWWVLKKQKYLVQIWAHLCILMIKRRISQERRLSLFFKWCYVDCRKRIFYKFWWATEEILFKACVRYYLFFHQIIALQKLPKMLFISSKRTHFVLKITKFLYFRPPFFSSLSTIASEDDWR